MNEQPLTGIERQPGPDGILRLDEDVRRTIRERNEQNRRRGIAPAVYEVANSAKGDIISNMVERTDQHHLHISPEPLG